MTINHEDGQRMAQEIEAVITRYLYGLGEGEAAPDLERPGLLILLTLPPEYKRVRWISNLPRQEAIRMARDGALVLAASEN